MNVGDRVFVNDNPPAYGTVMIVGNGEHFCHMADEISDWYDWMPESVLQKL